MQEWSIVLLDLLQFTHAHIVGRQPKGLHEILDYDSTLELLDKDGKVLFTAADEVGGARPDMEVRPRQPIEGVHKIRFTSLAERPKYPANSISLKPSSATRVRVPSKSWPISWRSV